jgi:hypothetical protein
MNGKVIFIVVLIAFLGWKVFYHPKFPELPLGTLAPYSKNSSFAVFKNGPCEGRDRCVFVYFAPWCPACKGVLNEIRKVRDAWKNNSARPGMMIVVGNAEEDALNGMAEQIGPPVFLDTKDIFLKALHVKSLPYFIIIDAQQNILLKDSQAGYEWVMNEMKK